MADEEQQPASPQDVATELGELHGRRQQLIEEIAELNLRIAALQSACPHPMNAIEWSNRIDGRGECSVCGREVYRTDYVGGRRMEI